MPTRSVVEAAADTAADETCAMGSRLRRSLAPAALIAVCPPFVGCVWYTHVRLDGSLAKLARMVAGRGFFATMAAIWRPIFFGTPRAWAMIAAFAALQLILVRALPGRRALGPPTPSGNVAVYRDNGLFAFGVTIALFAAGAGAGLFPATIIYDEFGPLLGALNIFSLAFCLLLYFKGRLSPSSSDCGASGNAVFDYYWGTELHPQLLGWDVKQITNCRFGMMSWPLIVLSFAAKQHELYGLSDGMAVAVALQLVYVAKFFAWEAGYLRSLDMAHDRAGFYLCWGCLVWVPAIYTGSTLYLVNHPRHLGVPAAIGLCVLGSAAILTNYAADRQRQRVRATNGRCTIWGRQPQLIVARYRTSDGQERQNMLLASGFWGISRHFHYLPELLGALCWTLPVGATRALPWFYPAFLAILLIDRAFRDDRRCAEKYGKDWDDYRARVRWKIIPGVL